MRGPGSIGRRKTRPVRSRLCRISRRKPGTILPSATGLIAGGGAPSLIFAKPWWQAGPGVPNDQARDVPDVALAASGAHDAYALYVRGQLVGVGGTSAAAPSFAGIVAILNQYLIAKGAIPKAGLGNINPALYNLAQNTTGLFHDIVGGNNIVPCAAGSNGCSNGSEGYSAGVGYDLATGLGSVDAYNLVSSGAAFLRLPERRLHSLPRRRRSSRQRAFSSPRRSPRSAAARHLRGR